MKADSSILQAGGGSQQIIGMLAGLQLCRIEDDRISVGDAQLGANLRALLVRQSRVFCEAGVVDRVGHRKRCALRARPSPGKTLRLLNRWQGHRSGTDKTHSSVACERGASADCASIQDASLRERKPAVQPIGPRPPRSRLQPAYVHAPRAHRNRRGSLRARSAAQ